MSPADQFIMTQAIKCLVKLVGDGSVEGNFEYDGKKYFLTFKEVVPDGKRTTPA